MKVCILRPSADITIVGAKMANSLDRSSELHRTYAPVDLAAVRNARRGQVQGASQHAGSQAHRLERYWMRGRFQNKSCNSSKAKRPICNFFSGKIRAKHLILLATPAGLEPATNSLE